MCIGNFISKSVGLILIVKPIGGGRGHLSLGYIGKFWGHGEVGFHNVIVKD